MTSRGIFTNERSLPLQMKNTVEVNGHLIALILSPSDSVLKLMVDDGKTLNTSYDIFNVDEVTSAYMDFAAYITAASRAGSEPITNINGDDL